MALPVVGGIGPHRAHFHPCTARLTPSKRSRHFDAIHEVADTVVEHEAATAQPEEPEVTDGQTRKGRSSSRSACRPARLAVEELDLDDAVVLKRTHAL